MRLAVERTVGTTDPGLADPFMAAATVFTGGGAGGAAALRLAGPAQKNTALILAEFFGQRAAGAVARLEAKTLTPGITKEMLLDYAAQYARPIATGLADAAKRTARAIETQSARLRLIEAALRNWF